MDGHYSGIIAGYGAATTLVWLLWLVARPVIAGPEPVEFKRPWLEVGLVIIAAALTIGVGQLYSRGLLLAEDNVAMRSANQLLIFAPLLLVVFARAHAAKSAGLPFGRPLIGFVVGLALAVGAIVLYATVRRFDVEGVFASVVRLDNIPHAAQVLFEDIAIAALLLRMRGAVGGLIAIALVAALFAAGHIPAMLANGATQMELATLFLDAGIGILVLGAVMKTRSIWWLWPLHTAMDLTQFFTPSP